LSEDIKNYLGKLVKLEEEEVLAVKVKMKEGKQ